MTDKQLEQLLKDFELLKRENLKLRLLIIELEEKIAPQDLYMAWKISNKGKGLKQLISILSNEY